MRRLLSSILFVSLVLSASPAAAKLYPIRNSKVYAGDAPEVAQRFLQDHAVRFDLGTVELVHRTTLALGDFRTVRFIQQYEGLPVLGTAAAVRVSPGARVTACGLRVARDLTVSPRPQVSRDEIRTLLHGRVGPWAASGPLRLRLAVLPELQGPGRLVWQVTVPTGTGGLRFVVDAHRGAVLHERPLAVHVNGRVYPISSVVTPNTTDVELTDLDVSTPQRLTGWNGGLVVTNYVSGGHQTALVAEQVLEPSDGTDFLYDPPVDPTDATDGFAQVSLYYHLTRMRDFFAGDLGLDFTQPGFSLAAVANAARDGVPLDNAYFSEQGLGAPFNTDNVIAVGQGHTFDFSDDSDVFLHEFTHYVSHAAVGYNMTQYGINEYGLSPHSGSIDEGLSDYFACSLNGDPNVGEASLALLNAGRDLTDTSKVCPDDVYGEVHLDGEIIGSFAWTLQTDYGKGVADQLIWGTLGLLFPYATFGDFGLALIQTANDLVTGGQLSAADVTAIQASLDARGLSDCFHELPIAPGAPRNINLVGLDTLAANMGGGSCANLRSFGVQLNSFFHVRAQPAPTDQGIRLRVTLVPDGGMDLMWKVFGRQGTHVTFDDTGMLPVAQAFDYQTNWLNETTAELVVDVSSEPAFDPGQTYHFVIAHQNCPQGVATFTVEPVVDGPTLDGGVGDGGVSADASSTNGGGKKGCNCQSTSGPYGALPVLLVLLGLLWIRRRRG